MGLCLSRKVGESIVIDHKVTVTVSAVRQAKGNPVVSLVIEAPKEIEIFRYEIEQQRNKEHEANTTGPIGNGD